MGEISTKSIPATRIFWFSMVGALALTVITALFGPRLAAIPHLPDKGPAWYYWQLANPGLWSRVSAWGGYALHQITVWYLVIRAMKEKPHANSASRLNIAMLAANGGFILLHLLQTHIWYDGLAQDAPIWTSQFSVIVMLVIILMMLIPKRGLILGGRIAIPASVLAPVRRYHGLYISWALVYTFWFHPMEGEYGLLIGFGYMFFLMIQMSMFNTKIHFNMAWIGFLEFFVGLHGAFIAIMKGQEVWPMFLFGFLFMTVFTQIYGVPLGRFIRVGVIGLYVAGIIVVYAFRGFGRVFEITFIPVALYGGAVALWLISSAGVSLQRRLRASP